MKGVLLLQLAIEFDDRWANTLGVNGVCSTWGAEDLQLTCRHP